MRGPILAPVDEARQADLRRMKAIATAFLVGAALVYLVARANEDGRPWVGYVRAAAEAAMVGALADWFAVTALFRHPLGVPIPHTAIIPHRKDQIGRSLGEFVEGNFLTTEILTDRLAGARLGARLGGWLAEPRHAARAANAVADALKGTIEVIDDRDVQDALGSAVEQRLRSTEVAPLVGKAIDVALEGGHHQHLFDSVLTGLGSFLDENRATFRRRLEQESPWWVPETIDDRIFEKIYTAVHRFLSDIAAEPDHEVRKAIDARIRVLAERLRSDPTLIAKAEEVKLELLAHRDVQEWLSSLWLELKRAILVATGDPSSELRERLAVALARVGRKLEADPELQAKVDDWIERAAVYVVENYRSEVSDIIATTVERWDGADTSRRIELQVGRDLQFIRINGTVVGGLAGLLIHAVGETLFG
jgi:uncharacterized membrane-anchored protein YjiN (DUF445 family)